MASRTLVLTESTAINGRIDEIRELCRSYAVYFEEPIDFAVLPSDLRRGLRESLDGREGVAMETVGPATPVAATMSAADFVYREDGRPDWGAMWQSFCDLALYGGPPHRGPDDPVEAPSLEDGRAVSDEMVTEIRRGVFETTGLFAEPSPGGWLAVSCSSKRMAAWMCASIILENVDARCEEERLYVPAGPGFELKNQVKSVITVVAKVNHYWQAHVEEQARKG